jgi:hypothetical protein
VERWRAGMKEKSLDINDLHLSYSVVVEDTGHAPMMEEPEASAGHYLHFLAASNISLSSGFKIPAYKSVVYAQP